LVWRRIAVSAVRGKVRVAGKQDKFQIRNQNDNMLVHMWRC
jgi:hypothetical protein